MHVSVTSYIQQSGIFPVDSTGSHKLKDKEKDKYRGGEVNSRISPKVYCNNTPRKRFYGDWIPPHSCKILLRGPRAPARVVHRYLSEEERERRKEKKKKRRKSYSSGRRPPIRRQLFFSLRYEVLWRIGNRVGGCTTPECHGGHRRPSGDGGHCPFPAGRIYFVEVVAVACQPRRGEPRTS